jgi:hypothetical protein
MLLVLLNWLLILGVSLPLGYATCRGLHVVLGGQRAIPHASVAVFAGWVTIATLAHVAHYFVPIGVAFQLGVAILALAAGLRWSRDLRTGLRRDLAELTSGGVLAVGLFAGLTVAVLQRTAAPVEILLDMGDYHVPAIRWNEVYPLTPGIGLLEDRLAFNSSWHMLSAVFTMRWMGCGPFLELTGLLMVVVAFSFLRAVTASRRDGLGVSSLFRLLALALAYRLGCGLCTPDAPVTGVTLFALGLALEALEAGENEPREHGLIAMVLVVCLAVTMKLTATFLLLVLVWYLLCFARSWRAWLGCLGIGLVVATPWVARWYVLSGYLVYPIYQIDLFAPDWKIPLEVARSSQEYVTTFARLGAGGRSGAQDLVDQAPLEWVPIWCSRMAPAGLALVAGAGVSLLAVGAWAVRFPRRALTTHRQVTTLLIAVVVNLLVWFVMFPAFRFGAHWVMAATLIPLGLLTGRLRERHQRWARALVLLALCGLLARGLILGVGAQVSSSGHVVRQAELPAPPTRSLVIDGIRMRCPVEGGCWDTVPPCAPEAHLRQVTPRGEDLRAGFRPR